MTKYILTTTALLSILSCSGESSNKMDINNATANKYQHFTTDVPIMDYEGLKKIIENNNDKLLILNFWATWCKPCIVELPAFMEVNNKYKDKSDYKMILVNLDRKDNMEGIKNFLKDNKIDTEVYLLDDNKRMNTWIPETDSSWTGAIPATIFIKNGVKTYFHGGEMKEQKLDSIISSNYKF